MRDPATNAALFAAYKVLERTLKLDGEIPPGFRIDLSGTEITIRLPPETIVSREPGEKNDGVIWKKASQNLYGFTFFTMLANKLASFKQWGKIKEVIISTVLDALAYKSSARQEIALTDPELSQAIEEMQRTLNIPLRRESTPRICRETELPATINIKPPK
jgi:hypothetical protein